MAAVPTAPSHILNFLPLGACSTPPFPCAPQQQQQQQQQQQPSPHQPTAAMARMQLALLALAAAALLIAPGAAAFTCPSLSAGEVVRAPSHACKHAPCACLRLR
jgi:hypothetical protein